MLLIRLSLLLMVLACLAARAQAQCDFVWRSGGPHHGSMSTVTSIFEWDPDGEKGPSQPLILVGGSFRVGAVNATVPAWDGTEWVGIGSNLYGVADGYVEFHGQLLAYGSFRLTPFGPSFGLARWNGAAWERFAMYPGEGQVAEAIVYQDELILAGHVGPGFGQGIVYWNGTDWTPLGQGTSGWVRDLTTWNGELVAAGGFTSMGGVPSPALAAWNGANWRSLAQSIVSDHGNGSVEFAHGHGSDLYVYGNFDLIDGVPVQDLARWNGEWWSFVGGALDDNINGLALTMSSHNGDLYLAGSFHDLADIQEADKLARWDGSQWHAVATLVSAVHAVQSTSRGLVIGGQFLSVDGVPAWRIATQQAAGWQAMPSPGIRREVNALVIHEGVLYSGGGESVSQVSAWDGTRWTQVGGEFDGTVLALQPFEGALLAAGDFDSVVGNPASRIVSWNGVAWEDFAPGAAPISAGTVYAMHVHEGTLHIAGSAISINGVPLRGAARWSGQSWEVLGDNLVQSVRALATHNDELIAGGSFQFNANPLIGGVARWNGQTWEPVGAGVPSTRALAVHDGQLFAGAVGAIGRWDGQTWQTVSIGSSGVAYSFAYFNGKLFAAGGDMRINGVSGNRAVVWNGTTWSAVPLSISPTSGTAFVRALAAWAGELFAGGNFTITENAPSAYVARYGLASGSTADCNANGILDECDLVPGGGSDDNNDDGVPDECQSFTTGDMNCNGVVNVADIAGFVLALTDPAGYAAQFPSCDILNGDCNGNGVVNVADVGAFVQLLTAR